MAGKVEKEATIQEEFKVPVAEVGNHIVQVLPGLWLGDRFAAADRALLHERNICAVINCASAPPDKDEDWVRVAAKFGFVVPCFHTEPSAAGYRALRYMLVPVKDEAAEPISEYFEEAASFIAETLQASEGVLIHCEAGRSRAATVTLAYLMKSLNLSLSEALSKIKLQNRAVFPNDGFIAQLHAYAEKIGVKPAQADYLINGEADSPTETAIEKNMKTCAWRLEQGAWFTTPAKEVELLQGTGFALESCVALGTLIALEKDSMSRARMQEVFAAIFSQGLVTKETLCDAYRSFILEDPAETDYPILEDVKLDVPFADEYLGGFIYVAQVEDLLTEGFLDFVAAKYPNVKQHMVEKISDPQ
mmetsp:Transcript_7889/g.14159  ORF Transcript_7889/g.14159 Transcript_7889/m.14159 type:complete len:361 (-) Transcript_7889:229-1311(-)|eukprot:CAMPEP_0177762592 /NCGR_PEP_ID=MMETSP0491_2-20121128/6427_1 /TAXON_ID=63592 /ORGANISM="Tetraselmis chuii, Strain PLY429" /LENGTH=360 /DNA_ID=CAMNT_0019278657 /DNA_START=130 /DNA_END=1212 /DNA_ORIENTATION=-